MHLVRWPSERPRRLLALKPILEQRADLSRQDPPITDRAADPLTFDALFEEWFDRVASWVRALGAPECDEDDLVQDVFLVVYRRLPDFDGENLPAWLYQIARRRVRDFRSLTWIRHVFTRAVPISTELVLTAPSPAEQLESKEHVQLLSDLLGALNPDQRAAFVLLEIEGYTGAEIARLQGVPLNTVWARIHSARKRLQKEIAKRERHLGRGP